MLHNREKAELIISISDNKQDTRIQSVLQLIEILIDESRKEFDNANRLRFLRLQGKIQAYQELRDTIERGIPNT
jgi:DNA polymerase IIIc chi subunit